LPTADWHATFYGAAGMNAVAAVLALLVLKPLRAQQITNDRARVARD
jgi:hypothetical protein